jgi:hypothetical protein
MKTTLTILSLGLLFCGCSKHSPDSPKLVEFAPDKSMQGVGTPVPAPAGRSSADAPAGSIFFSGIGLSQVLTIYAKLTDAQLLIEPRVQSLPVSVTFSNRQDLTRAETVSLFEESLHKQAGLVFEHQDARHIAIRLEPNSVTK